jgi:hypothetical protein
VFDKSSEVEELLLYCDRLHEGSDTAPGRLA